MFHGETRSGYCVDYPCCGHSPSDPCDGVVILTAEEATETYYCDLCGYSHPGVCRDDYLEENDNE